MSKPTNGIIWLYNCPNCGNSKNMVTYYKEYDLCKCTKCKNKFKIKKEQEKGRF